MNDSIKRMSLDIHSTSSGETVNAKRGDTARKLIISLVDGGLPYIIGEDCYAVFTGKKPDRNVVFNDCTIKDNTIIYKFTEQTVAVEGRVNCEIKLYGADGKLITSPKFTICVFGTVYNEGDEVESSDEFNALTKMVGEAQQATKEAKEAAQNAAHTAKSLMVAGKVKGTAISLDDAINQYLVGCRIFGKTTQDGVPTPDAPVDLVSSVEGESLSLFVTGKNLFTGWIVGGVHPTTGEDYAVTTQRRTDYIPISAPGQKYSISKIPNTLFNLVAFYDANKTYISRTAAGPSGGRLIEPPATAKYFRVSIYENAEASGKIAEADTMANTTMIEAGSIVTAYEPAKPIQKATVTTPNGLRGIPVTSGGNYTDADGQQWICDAVDLTRGVYVQRVGLLDFSNMVWYWDETYDIWRSQDFSGGKGRTPLLCETIPYVLLSLGEGTITGTFINAPYNIWVRNGSTENTPSGKAYYQMNTPIETPLSEEELAAYDALHTYRDNTTVSNDAGAYMELEYVMDAKKYIDSLVVAGGASARLSSVTLLASKWTGSDSLYSQVVTINGITPYSKVDLLPSVEQLAIFHNKDVAFVTENEDGVVTVFAIGDKPTQDYTMQVQITEVAV